MILGKLAASLLGNMLAGKGVVKGHDKVIWAGEEQIEQDKIFNAASSLPNFEIQKHYQNINLDFIVFIHLKWRMRNM